MLISRRRRLGTGGGGPSVADHLAFTTQPVGSTSPNLATQPVVAAEKADGSTDTTYAGSVTLTLNVLTGSATLGGTTSVALSSGVATFTNVTVTSAAGATWTLTAALAGLASATSNTGTTAAGVTTYRQDTFDRANGAIGTPSDGGSAWVTVGTYSVASNQATTAVANSYAFLESSHADCTIRVTLVTVGDGIGIAWRGNTFQDCLVLRNNGVGVMVVAERVAGTETAFTSENFAIANGDVITIVCSGNVSSFLKNGVSTGVSHTSANNATNTKHGLCASSGMTVSPVWDDFSVKSA